jgi:hypothetical protein
LYCIASFDLLCKFDGNYSIQPALKIGLFSSDITAASTASKGLPPAIRTA